MNPVPSSPAYDTALAAHDGSWLQEIMPSVTRRTSSTRAVQGFSAGSSHRTGGSSEAPDSGRVLCFFSQLHATRSSFGNGAVTCAMAISQQLSHFLIGKEVDERPTRAENPISPLHVDSLQR